MTYSQLMLQSLSDLLEDGETLKHPVYGTLLQKHTHWFGFWGLTDKHLLIALLKGSSKKISWSSRIPLEIKEVTRRKSIFPRQFILNIKFHRGNPCKIRFSEKVYGIESQQANLNAFVAFLQEAAHERF